MPQDIINLPVIHEHKSEVLYMYVSHLLYFGFRIKYTIHFLGSEILITQSVQADLQHACSSVFTHRDDFNVQDNCEVYT